MNSYSMNSYDSPFSKLTNYIDSMKEKYPVDETELVGDGMVFYMNRDESTMSNWNNDGHVCEFVIFYNEGWGYMKVTVNKTGEITGYVFIPDGQSPAKALPIRSMSTEEAEAFCALMNKIADKRDLYNKPIDELDTEAELTDADFEGIRAPKEKKEKIEYDYDDNELPSNRYIRELVGKHPEDTDNPLMGSYGSVIGMSHNSSRLKKDSDGETRVENDVPRETQKIRYSHPNSNEDDEDYGSHSMSRAFGRSMYRGKKVTTPVKRNTVKRNTVKRNTVKRAPAKKRVVRNTKYSKRPFTNKPVRMPAEIAKYIRKHVKKASSKSAKNVTRAVETSNRMVRNLAGRKTSVKTRKQVKKTVRKNNMVFSGLGNSVRRMF